MLKRETAESYFYITKAIASFRRGGFELGCRMESTYILVNLAKPAYFGE